VASIFRGPVQPAVKQTAVAKSVAAKKAAVKKTSAAAKRVKPPGVKEAANRGQLAKVMTSAPARVQLKASSMSPASPAMLQKMTDSLRKMGDKRPGKQVSLQRALKPLLGVAASEESIKIALNNLIARAVVAVGVAGGVTYPQFAKETEAAAAKP
jgi:hypothetical protein